MSERSVRFVMSTQSPAGAATTAGAGEGLNVGYGVGTSVGYGVGQSIRDASLEDWAWYPCRNRAFSVWAWERDLVGRFGTVAASTTRNPIARILITGASSPRETKPSATAPPVTERVRLWIGIHQKPRMRNAGPKRLQDSVTKTEQLAQLQPFAKIRGRFDQKFHKRLQQRFNRFHAHDLWCRQPQCFNMLSTIRLRATTMLLRTINNSIANN